MTAMLNIAGPDYDFGNVVFVVLEECEHRRRGFEDSVETQALKTARARLAKIKAAYDECGGTPAYWTALETEVMETAMPQYIAAAKEMNALERAHYNIWRGGDPLARFGFALAGLTIGAVIIALPFFPIVERLFAFALAILGFLYPEMKRWTHERRHFKLLNRLVADATRYQQNARLHYMTSNDIDQLFALEEPKEEKSHDSPR
jgi:hypothetical protein